MTDLSIVVPTYNRASFLPSLLTSLGRLLGTQHEVEWEVVVSDNHTVGGIGLGHHLLGNRLRIIMPPIHLGTAEENLLFALGEARGRYVWVLGDDDIVLADSIPHLLQIVKDNIKDIAIFNSGSISAHGFPMRAIRTFCWSETLEMPLLEFIRRTGFWFVAAGFSTLVFRREHLRLERFSELVGISKIYSHVTFLIECFHDKRFMFMNRPLVLYRQNLSDVTDTGHWRKVALREGHALNYPWTLGFIRLLRVLEQSRIVDKEFISQTLDQDLERRFSLVLMIAKQLLDQMRLHFVLPDRLRMRDDDIVECIEYLALSSPRYQELWRQLLQLRELNRRAGRVFGRRLARHHGRRLNALLSGLLLQSPLLQYFVGFVDGTAHYKSPWGNFAVKPDQLPALLESFNFIDLDLCADAILVDESLGRLGILHDWSNSFSIPARHPRSSMSARVSKWFRRKV